MAVANLFELLRQADPSTPGVSWVAGSLTYGETQTVVARLAGQLRSLGVTALDRVAIVLPNGPEAALATLAAASCAIAAPLNPRYQLREFSFYSDDLEPALLITSDDRADLRDLGLPVATVVGSPGELHLQAGGTSVTSSTPEFAAPGDAALVLHTSGTTSRPKQVPLTHTNLVSSARNIAATLDLTTADRCLNVMPLFHIHGLVGALFSSLSAGAEIVCSPGFDALRFRRWVDQVEPSWVTAVPTMYQLILARAGRSADEQANSLRFLRSSSASMPPTVMADVEALFGVPLIESYGMSEASHQMTSNPLPPGVRKPGSVGLDGGTEVKVLLESGADAGVDEEGEVVIRGPSVTKGYHANPDANAEAFVDGWFRTGDSGTIDSDGYLFLTGRLKELINRGGTKISPRQIDEILLEHPEVAQAVAFAMPHRFLGEEVAAAVVVEPGADLSEGDLRSFAAESLSDQRVPKRIVFVDEIPKGPTGKLQRIGLAKALGVD